MFTLNAGQSIQIPAVAAARLQWSVTGSSCSNQACGTVTPAENWVTYTAPASAPSQMQVMLRATEPNLGEFGKVTLTVNPPISFSAALANGAVGAPYSGSITVKGGSNPVHLSLAGGSLPPGLNFNSTDGSISGTPITAGSYTLSIKATDASDAATDETMQRTVTIADGAEALRIVTRSLPAGKQGNEYAVQLSAAGGAEPYAWAAATRLPAGLSLTATGVLQGVLTNPGISTIGVQVSDQTGSKATSDLTLTVDNNLEPLKVGVSGPVSATIGAPYVLPINIAGGNAPYTCSISAGMLPASLTLAGCNIRGTPSVPGRSTVAVMVTDSAGSSASTGNFTLNVTAGAAKLVLTSPPAATVNSTYTGSIGIGGGTAPYGCSILSGSIPGLTLSGCTLTGRPSTAGTFPLSITAFDSSLPANTSTGSISLVVNPATPGTLSLGTPPAATVGSKYNAAIDVSGGKAPYSCTVTGGTLPPGLSQNNCALTGIPTVSGNFLFNIKATDAGDPTAAGSASISLLVQNATPNLIVSGPAAATAGRAYEGSIVTTGGAAPYACSIASGSLPAGLAMSNCSIIGTPTTAGSANLTIKVVDSGQPQASVIAPVTVMVNPSPVNLTLTAPPAGTVGAAYSGSIGVSGGNSPYTCSVVSGLLPVGLNLNGCNVAGTPTTSGSYNFSVRATDASSPANSTVATLSINIAPAAATLTITSPPAGTAGSVYSGVIGVSGGTAPYTCVLAGGTLPEGLSLNGCSIAGTPVMAAVSTVSIRATDSANPANNITASVNLIINAAPATLTISSPPAAVAGLAYSGSIGVAGGKAPYVCSVASGSLPQGLVLTGCSLTGTIATSGTYSLSIKASDSANPANSTTGPVSLVVNPAPATLTIASPPAATVGLAYTGSIAVSGGTAPYSCSVAGGTLPSGLTLTGCALTGTPTKAGISSLSIKASDAASPANSTTSSITVTVNPAPVSLTLSSPPTATAGATYNGAIAVSGGTAPYTCTVASGTIPAGLSLGGCSFTGTPTTAGSYPLSIKATDSASPANTTTAPITLTVNTGTVNGSQILPHINYTDLNVGSGSGGDTGNGVYVRIFGSHFGATQGSSTLTLGGPMVTSCSKCSWSDQLIVAQLGPSASTGQIVVTVNGLASNGMPFTVAPTTILFVAPNGADNNPGSFTAPFKTWRAAFNAVTSNDSRPPSQNTVIYLEPGTDVSFDDGRGYKAAISTDIGGTSPTSQLSIVGYPGGTVNVGSSSIANGVKGWGNYITIANLNIVGQSSAIDAEAGDIRIINNSISCPAPPSGLGGTACVLGETTDPSETWVFHGNNVHDTGGKVDKTYHAVYFSSNVNHADVGWNSVGQNFKGYCRGIMFHATLGANQYDLHIHDNVITNSYCDGIGLASVDPSKGIVEVYNNIVAHTALASNPYGVANEAGIAINSDPAGSSSGDVQVYNNTVVDAGAYTTGNQNGCFGVVFAGAGMRLTNNICSQPSSAQPYIEKGSSGVSGSNNLWYGAGPAPAWDTAPVNSDPRFTSATDYSLQSQSPAKSIGATSTMSPIDIIGVPRGADPSVGAHQ